MTSEPLGGNGERAGVELIEKDLSIVRSGYAAEKASDEVKIQMLQEDESLEEVFPLSDRFNLRVSSGRYGERLLN